MVDALGTIDWFTKKRFDIDSSRLEEARKALVREFVKFANRSTDFPNFVGQVSESLMANELLNMITSETRLPVCPLYHHLRNTAALAVCLAYCNGIRDDELQKIRLAGLLHDIGKLSSKHYYDHQSRSEDFVRELIDNIMAPKLVPPLTEVRALVAHHHSTTATTSLEKLVSKADSIASAMDRLCEVIADYDENAFLSDESVSVTLKSLDKFFTHTLVFNRPNVPFQIVDPKNPSNIVTLTPMENQRTVLLKYIGSTPKTDPSSINHQNFLLFHDELVNGGPIFHLGSKKPKTDFHLLGVDIPGIQRYIGESKKLPILRGGSLAIREVTNTAEREISRRLGSENVLFNGGGRLVALLPADQEFITDLEEKIRKKAQAILGDDTRIIVKSIPVTAQDLIGNFHECLKRLNTDLAGERYLPQTKPLIPITRSDQLCSSCGKRRRTGDEFCTVCSEKEHHGKSERQMLRRDYFPSFIPEDQYPQDFSNLGKNIALISFDGNMMGTIFQATRTPAQYTYKSHRFQQLLDETLTETISEMLDKHPHLAFYVPKKDSKYLAIDVVYTGGDDIMMVTGAPIALHFTDAFLKHFRDAFYCDAQNRPTATLSAGLAIARHKFPVYHLLGKAEELLDSAKSGFRHQITVDKTKTMRLPDGALAFATVTDAMPSEDEYILVQPQDQKYIDELKLFVDAINVNDPYPASIVSLIVNLEPGEAAALNAMKFLHARLSAKSIFEKAGKFHPSAQNSLDILNSLSDIILNIDERRVRLKALLPLATIKEGD